MNITKFKQAVSATEPDWSREQVRRLWDPGRKLLRAVRKYQDARQRDTLLGRVAARYWVANHWFWSLVTQSEIHLNCHIEGGLLLPHPTGIIIHPSYRIGPNFYIFQYVSLVGTVELGGHCDVGAGAKRIGPIKIGGHVQVGANAVVTKDVPECSIVVGIPARVLETGVTDHGSR